MEVFGSYPLTRLRRNRAKNWTREIIAETHLCAKDLILPLFICDHEGEYSEEIPSLPGVFRHSIESMLHQARHAQDLAIPAIALFPYVEEHLKTEDCLEAWNPNNLICKALKRLKKELPDLGVICDIALDPYNIHGHDGFVKEGEVLNDETIEALKKQALCMAQAGATALAPSDMMDGRILAIRQYLEDHGFLHLPIISYGAKYASCFYGPFRDAVGSSGHLSFDKKSYQMDYRNTNEAISEVALDFSEGADMVIIKPAMAYLDIIYRIKEEFKKPVLAYQVSGEYAMIMAAAQNEWLEKDRAIIESLTAMKRAGADGILTYFAIEAAELFLT